MSVCKETNSNESVSECEIVHSSERRSSEECMSKKYKSTMWERFQSGKNPDGTRITSYINPQGTSNLWKQNRKFHGSSNSSQTILTSSGKVQEIQPHNEDASEKITKQIVATIVDAVLTFITVKNREFVKLLILLQPLYRPVSRQKIQRRILEDFKIQQT